MSVFVAQKEAMEKVRNPLFVLQPLLFTGFNFQSRRHPSKAADDKNSL